VAPRAAAFHKDNMTKTGTIKFWNEAKGYGFIVTEDSADIFAHASQLVGEFLPNKHDRVQFIEGVGRGGRPCAQRIVILR
jgi:cold shock protein